jgi:hypothetical protein
MYEGSLPDMQPTIGKANLIFKGFPPETTKQDLVGVLAGRNVLEVGICPTTSGAVGFA